MNSATKYETESELEEVFREVNGKDISARERYATEFDNPMYFSHHAHTLSTESQTAEYREQIVRMSKRQFKNSTKNQGMLLAKVVLPLQFA